MTTTATPELMFFLGLRVNSPLAEVKTYYAKAALEYPPFYGNYSFDEWMAFTKSNGLVLRHPPATWSKLRCAAKTFFDIWSIGDDTKISGLYEIS